MSVRESYVLGLVLLCLGQAASVVTGWLSYWQDGNASLLVAGMLGAVWCAVVMVALVIAMRIPPRNLGEPAPGEGRRVAS